MCRVSILVPVYNVEKYIEHCAISLFEQTYDDIEYIFVNDCSKDDSIIILKNVISRYPNRSNNVVIVDHEVNTGLGGARLSGIQHATGEYLWCVDSDDWVETDAVERVMPYIQSGYDFITFNYYIEKSGKTEKFYNKNLTVNNVLYSSVSPSIWKCIVKRSLYINNCILPVVGINQSEDYLLTARLILVAETPILLEDQFYYHYNLTNVNSYVNNITVKSMENCVHTCLIVKDFYEKEGKLQDYKVCLAARMAFWYLDFYRIDKNNPLCKRLSIEIRLLDRVIYWFTKTPLINKEKLIRAYKRIIVKDEKSSNNK